MVARARPDCERGNRKWTELLVTSYATPSESVVCYYSVTGFEDTRGAITIIVDVFKIMQKIPDIGVHLKVDEEQGRVAQGSTRQVSGEPT